MTARGPWYLSARAVREYHRIATGRVDEPDDEQFDAAAEALQEAVGLARRIKVLPHGEELWRLRGRPRLRLLVSYAVRPEGELPQLVRVLPEHD
jgi:hypothetical protein